jgi:hypothetical protein
MAGLHSGLLARVGSPNLYAKQRFTSKSCPTFWVTRFGQVFQNHMTMKDMAPAFHSNSMVDPDLQPCQVFFKSSGALHFKFEPAKHMASFV